MKVGIIGGAGGVGSAIGFYLATQNLVDQIALIDLKQNVAKAHAMDMQQAIPELAATTITSGDWDALLGCNLVIMAAGAVQHNSLESNLAIVQSAGREIARYCPGAVVLTVTNPIDVLNPVLRELVGMPAKRILGFSLNDSTRLRTAIANLLKVSVADVQAMVIGEHGQAMVPLFSRVAVKGARIDLTQENKTDILNFLKNWFAMYNGLNAGRTAAWTTAVGVTQMVRLMVKKSEELVACSAILDGQYGISGVSIGVPVVLGPSGIERIVELPLSKEELSSLKAAGAKIAASLRNVHPAAKTMKQQG